MKKLLLLLLLICPGFAQHIDWSQLANPPGWTPQTTRIFSVNGGLLINPGPTYSSGGTSCTNGTQTVTFTNNTIGTNATGTITVSGGHPTGIVTIITGGNGYAASTPPTTGTVATCTGTTTFTGGTVNGSLTSGFQGPVFSSANAGANINFETFNQSSVGYGNGTWAMQGDAILGTLVQPAAAANSGGYLQFWPLNYAPGNSSPPCNDIYGNSIQMPVPVSGMADFGYGTNETLNTNTAVAPLNVVLDNPGSGWTVGQTFTVNGSSGTAAQGTVTSVSGGAVATFNITNPTNNGYTISPTTTNIGTTHTGSGSGTGLTVSLVSFQAVMYLTASPLPFANGACTSVTPIPQSDLYDLVVTVPFGDTQGLFSARDSFASYEGYAVGTTTATRGVGATTANFYSATEVPGGNGTTGTYLQDLQSQATLGQSSSTTNWNSTLGSGGTGWHVNDKFSGGGCSTAPTGIVLTVSGTTVTGYEILTAGAGCTIPASGVSASAISPATGTGLTLNYTGLSAGIFLGGAMGMGHSFGNPQAGCYFQTCSNPLSNFLTLQQGIFYWNDNINAPKVWDATQWEIICTNLNGYCGGVSGGAATQIPFVNSTATGFSYSAGLTFLSGTDGLIVGSGSTPGIVNVNVGTKTGGSPTCPTSSPPETFQNSDSSWYADCIGDIAGQTLTIGLTSGEAPFAVPLMVDSTAGSLFEVDNTSARPGMVNLVNANSTASNGACISGIDGYTSGATNSVSGELCVTFTNRTSHYGTIDFYTRDSGGINDRATISDTDLTLNSGMGLVIDTSYSINSSAVAALHGLSVDGTSYNSIQVTGVNGGVAADNVTLGVSGSGSAYNTLEFTIAGTNAGNPSTGATMYLNHAGTAVLLAVAGQNSSNYGTVCTSINAACGSGSGVPSITGTQYQVLVNGVYGVAETTASTLTLPSVVETSDFASTASTTATAFQTAGAQSGSFIVTGYGDVFHQMSLGMGVISEATKFTISGCSAGTTVGGAAVGSFKSGTSGTCTVTITIDGATGLFSEQTPPNGWYCFATDVTTAADSMKMTTNSTTQCTLSGTTVSGDVIVWGAMGY